MNPVAMTYAEASNATEEAAAFAAGASMVVRLDLLPGYVAPVVPPAVLAPGDPSLRIVFDALPFVDSALNPHAITPTGSPAVVGGMGDFSAAGSGLVIADAPDLRFGTHDFELAFDYKLKAALPANTHSFMVSKGTPGNLNGCWYLALLSGNMLGFVTANNATGVYVPYPFATDFTNSHEIKLRRVAGVVSLLVDNVVVGTCTPGAVGVPAIYEGAGSLYIGRWNYGMANTRGDCFDNFRFIPVLAAA